MGATLIKLIKQNWRIILLLLAVLLFLLYSRYSLLIVNTNTGLEEVVSISLNRPENGSQIVQLTPGANLIRRGTYDVTISSKKKKTVVPKKTSFLGIDSVQLDLKQVKKVDKITPNQEQSDCLFGDITRVYYVCIKGGVVRRTAGVVDKNDIVYDNISLVGDPVHYKDGILVYTIDTSATTSSEGPLTKLSYISAQGLRVLDANATRFQDEWGSNITTNGDEFVINNRSSQKLYFFKNSGSKPIEYSYNSDVDQSLFKNTIHTSLNNEGIFLSFSSPVNNTKGRDEDLGELNLLRFSVGSKIKLVKKLNLPKSLNSAASISVVDGVAAAYDDVSSRLDVLSITGDGASILQEIINVENVAISSESIFYSKQGDIYEYDPVKMASFMITSTRGTVNYLTGTSEKLIFWLTPSNTPSQVSSFVINTKIDGSENVTPYDILPYRLDTLPVYSTDYSANTLVFNVKLDSLVYYRDLEKPAYDQDEFLTKQKTIRDQLKQDGLDITKYKLLFELGP